MMTAITNGNVEKPLQIDADKVWEFIVNNDPRHGRDPESLKALAIQILPEEYVNKRLETGSGVIPFDDWKAKVEALAEQIYNDWKGQSNFVPWTPGGNSLKQDEARLKAAQRMSVRPVNKNL